LIQETGIASEAKVTEATVSGTTFDPRFIIAPESENSA